MATPCNNQVGRLRRFTRRALLALHAVLLPLWSVVVLLLVLPSRAPPRMVGATNLWLCARTEWIIISM